MNQSRTNLDTSYNRTYLAELCLPPGFDILRKCRCSSPHYCQYYRYNYGNVQSSCICSGTCDDCRNCDSCNTPKNRIYAKYYKCRWRWRQPNTFLDEIKSIKLDKQLIESGFKDIWPALIYDKIRSYL